MLLRSSILTFLVLLAAGQSGVLWAADAPRPAIGVEIKSLGFKDIRYLPRTLDDLGEHRATVIVFTNTTCPLVQKYWPKLKRLQAEFSSQQVQFLSINSSAGDEIAAIAEQALDFGVEFPVVRDTDGACALALGIERTPEVVILDQRRRLCYRGRIDDQHRLGGTRPEVTEDDLVRALREVLNGTEVTRAETPVDGCRITFPRPPRLEVPVTYSEHIAPLIQRHCVECHRPQGGAPFALLTLDDVLSHSEMIAEVVADRRMPPWYGSRRQHFFNERGLTSAEREQVIAWNLTGRTTGDVTKAPLTREFTEGKWEIGEPDLVTTAVFPHQLPAAGFVDYRYVLLPYVFTQDTWISAAEIWPSNPATVHHCNMAYMTLGEQFNEQNFITGRVPGGSAMVLDEGVALKIPQNSIVGLQIHYTTTGKSETNRMSVGFRFPRDIVRRELQHAQISKSQFEIPPGAAAFPVIATRTLPANATGIGMFAHMHLRGKDMSFRALYPDGQQELLLSIPNYHYDWQHAYRWKPGTRQFPKGTKIEVTAHFDNSRFNPFNPDPTTVVRTGPQTVQEMMFGFFFYTNEGEDLNLKVDPRTGHRLSKLLTQPPPRK